MQIVIDIDEKEYKRIINGDWIGNQMAEIFENGTVLPDNPTNGDMIKFLFPCLEKYEYEEPYTHGIALAGNDNRVTWFANGWWNAPYRKDGE